MKYSVPAVDNAAAILKFLSRYRHKKSTLTEISKGLNINKTACYRILKTLEANNFVYYSDAEKRYSLGYYISVLGERVEENSEYLKIINYYLQKCSKESGSTTALVQRVSFDRVMFVSQKFSNTYQKVRISVGNRFPLTEVSYGKWVLADMDEEGRKLFLEKGLPKITPYTVTDINEYINELNLIRDRKGKIVISREQYTPELLALSSGMYDINNRLIGVMVLMEIAPLVDETKELELINVLLKNTKECNDELLKLRIDGNKYPHDIF